MVVVVLMIMIIRDGSERLTAFKAAYLRRSRSRSRSSSRSSSSS
jgi:hypothetical protein